MDTPQTTLSNAESLAKRFALAVGQQRDLAHQFLDNRQERFEKAVEFVQRQLQKLEEDLASAHQEVEQLRADRNMTAERLAQAEAELAEAPSRAAPNADAAASSDEELKRRYEMAMSDLRDANKKNADLQQQLSKTRSSAAKLAQQSRTPGWLDWESEKQRILAALEEDEIETEEQKTERLATNEVLRITDKVIAVKDREIQELKHLLEDNPTNNQPSVVDDSAVKQAINKDAAIQEERQRLQELQKEWREKLRTSEIELSLERAKIARERAELDDQLRASKENRAKSAEATNCEGQSEPPVHGRWLSHFGLTPADREPNRKT